MNCILLSENVKSRADLIILSCPGIKRVLPRY